MKKYILDTNIIIRLSSWNPRGLKIYEHIWNGVDSAIAAGTVLTDSTVLYELEKHNSGAKNWVRSQSGMVIPMTDDIFADAAHVVAQCVNLVDPESERNHADPYIIAAARSIGGIVVSDEKPRKQQTDRCKVPDACNIMGVQFMNFDCFAEDFPWH